MTIATTRRIDVKASISAWPVPTAADVFAGVAPSACSPAVTAARLALWMQANSDLLPRRRFRCEQALGSDVGDASIVLQRGDDPGNPESCFVARGELDGKGRANLQAEHFGQALTHLRLVRAAQALA